MPTPEPKPFSAEFERLYDEYVKSGALTSWVDWLAARPADTETTGQDS